MIVQRIIELLCHWHKWGKWEDGGGITMQKRRCQTCGLTQWKT